LEEIKTKRLKPASTRNTNSLVTKYSSYHGKLMYLALGRMKVNIWAMKLHIWIW